jgi:hypothetical protein
LAGVELVLLALVELLGQMEANLYLHQLLQ